MIPFLVMLAVVYVARAAWPKLVSEGVAPMEWAWPIKAAKWLYDSVLLKNVK